MFVSEDRKLKAVHLILDFEPLSNKFQDVGHAIRAGNPRLAWIVISVPGFLAREDLLPVKLPLHCSPYEVAAPREEKFSLHLSLKEEAEAQEEPVEISDSKGELDRSSIVRSPRLIVTQVDSSSEEEKEMALKRKKMPEGDPRGEE